MKLTLVGICWSVLYIYALTRKKYDLSVFMLFLAGVLQCDSVIFLGNGEGIGLFLFSSILFDARVMALKVVKKQKIKSDLNLYLFLMMFICIVISYCLNGFSVDFSIILSVAPLTIYIFTYFCLLQIIDSISLDSIDKMLKSIILFVLVVGLLQYAIAIRILPNLGLMKNIIYNETEIKYSLYFNVPTAEKSRRLYSTFMEPSYCAAFLTAATFYILEIRKRIRNAYAIVFICLVEIILTKSSTAYGCLLICSLLYMFVRFHNVPKNFMLSLLGAVIIGIGLSALGAIDLNSIIFNKAETGSGFHRIWLNNKAIGAYESSKVFGIGYKAVRGSSLVYSLLGELGILGMISYLLLVTHNVLPYIIKKNKKAIPYYIWLFSAVMAQIIACPDLDFCLFWLCLYFVLAYRKCFYHTRSINNEVFDNNCVLQ